MRVFDKVRVFAGNEETVIGSLLRARKNRERANYFIAAEYDGNDGRVQVFYGRALLFAQFEYNINGKQVERSVYMADWLEVLKLDSTGQMFCDKPIERAFTSRSFEPVATTSRAIGIWEHVERNPRKRRTYILDMQSRCQNLVEGHTKSPDGIVRFVHVEARRR